MDIQLTPEQQKQHEHIVRDRAALHSMEQLFAESVCPHKIGDVMVSSKNGYRARVTKIRYSFLKPYYQVYGSIIRTNGTLQDKEIHLQEVFGNWRRE